MVKIHAHRGASGDFPENTMISFKNAIEQGTDYVETDVQMSADGVLMIMHDEKLKRTTGAAGFLKDYTYSELKKLDAGMWKDKKFKKERIPRVDELLMLAKASDVRINFEIKNGKIPYPNIEEKLINLIDEYGLLDRVMFSGFNHYSMLKCRQILDGMNRDVKIGLLYMDYLYHPYDYCKTVHADGIHPAHYSVNEEIIKECHKANLFVNVFTVNDEATMKKFISYDVDGIITNYPGKLRKLL
ncbi:glycerophosphodiester phosphodiesterase [Clostridium oryzae]|uniref:Glycerophosphoryl diester phosphodiesterase n=1 Tax=Clostridium oryzae TaxID=1450648 RepID=A0A1V4IY81_9CLOT|nr:glycerophosphodiester phosphodiesterase [Clostridium oryzae]OPJ65032.1 glycerophosphoryl diester phosphodiesterase [Clostridium oryzae]